MSERERERWGEGEGESERAREKEREGERDRERPASRSRMLREASAASVGRSSAPAKASSYLCLRNLYFHQENYLGYSVLPKMIALCMGNLNHLALQKCVFNIACVQLQVFQACRQATSLLNLFLPAARLFCPLTPV